MFLSKHFDVSQNIEASSINKTKQQTTQNINTQANFSGKMFSENTENNHSLRDGFRFRTEIELKPRKLSRTKEH